MASVTERIDAFHAGRDAVRLERKYDLLAASPNAFYRGTAHLFYEDLASEALPASPIGWITGDAHIENYGAYKGDNRLVYFDFNDFDEAARAPVLYDVLRMLVSIQLTAGRPLAEAFLASYAIELGEGKPRWVERSTAEDAVRELVYSLKGRSRKQLLRKRTVLDGGVRALRVDGEFALPLEAGEWQRLKRFTRAFGESVGRPEFFRLLAAARRIAGNGSLGIDRYVLLVEGKGSPDRNYLLDLKEARPSVVGGQPAWPSEAERVVRVQHRLLAVDPAFLHAVEFEAKSYVLRELVPREDRVRLSEYEGQTQRLEQLLLTESKVMAWAQLRASGREGAANADDLTAFGKDFGWHGPALAFAKSYAGRIKEYWREFSKARAAAVLPAKEKAKKATKSGRPAR